MTMSDPKFPEVHVQLSGEDGNAFMIASRTRVAMERAGLKEQAAEYFNEALSGDYDNVLQTTMAWVSTS